MSRTGRGVPGRGRAVVRGLAAALALAAAGGSLAASPPASAKEGAPHRQAASRPRLGACDAGEFCLWARSRFRGERRTYELSGISVGSCLPLRAKEGAESFANRTGRPATVYQSRECAENGEFDTYPSGSWTPEGAYMVRAVKIWER